MTGDLSIYRHPVAGFELPLPPQWERREDVDGVALVAVEPEREDNHFRANVVVTIEQLRPGEERTGWLERSLAALEESLDRLTVIDVDDLELDGNAARRVLTHYVHSSFGGVNLEQWSMARDGLGYVVSCSTAVLEYDDLWPLTSAIAEGLKASAP